MFDAAARGLERELPLIAEDLGVITPAVERLRDGLGFPGMVVLQFGFDPGDPGSPHNPWNHVEQRVVYTGTHDHDTVRGWYESIGRSGARWSIAAIDAAGVREAEPWWSLIRLAFASPARRGDGAGAGRARARQRGAHERAGHEGPLVAVGAVGAAAARPRDALRAASEAAGRVRRAPGR